MRKAHLRPIPDELDPEDQMPNGNGEEQTPDLDVGMQVMPSVIYKQSQVTAKYFRQIMGSGAFQNPKDHDVLARIIKYVTGGDQNAIILDSFAGSGTTAHAILALNKEDGGQRRFLLVECERYANTLTAERVRRVITGLPDAKDEALKQGLGGTFSFFELGRAITLEDLLSGRHLPSYGELARYVFYTATGEEFDERKVDEARGFIGESKTYRVYLLYVTDVERLKNLALTLDWAKALGPYKGKRRLVFAPTKYLDQDHLDQYWIDYAQLPYEIYGLVR
jgi:adenine-specific DNA-methyltransferase